jgi:hypothetical protein
MSAMTPEQFASGITFGEVGSMSTAMWEIEKLPLRNDAVFPLLLWTGKRCKTSKPPRITKCGQEPNIFPFHPLKNFVPRCSINSDIKSPLQKLHFICLPSQ